MTDEKKTLFNKLESINEEAHNYAYNLWEEAGRLEDEHGYTDEVEEKKILASDEQASSFKEIFENYLENELSDWYDLDTFQAQSVERLQIPDFFGPQLEHIATEYAGLDIAVSRTTYFRFNFQSCRKNHIISYSVLLNE